MAKSESTQYATKSDIETLHQMFTVLASGLDEIRNTLHTRLNDDLQVILENFDQLSTAGDRHYNDLLNGMVSIDDRMEGVVAETVELARTSAKQFDILMGMLNGIAEGRPESQSANQPAGVAGESDLRILKHRLDSQSQVMADMQLRINDLEHHVEKQKKFNESMNDRLRNLEILINAQDQIVTRLLGRINPSESHHEPQTDNLSERRGEEETPETGISISAGYRVERVAYNQGNIIEVVQRWLDSTPEFFQGLNGGVWPVPTAIKNFSEWSTIEFALLSAAERLRRHRAEKLRTQLGAFGPGSHAYPRLKIQGENALKESDKG
jgi:hypothetical protein